LEDQDWAAVGQAITDRLAERGMTLTDLANRSGVALTTVRELAHASVGRQRRPRVLAALSVALAWPEDRLTRILRGMPPDDRPAQPAGDLDELRQEVADLRARVEALESRQAP